jgi:hypothetical protein
MALFITTGGKPQVPDLGNYVAVVMIAVNVKVCRKVFHDFGCLLGTDVSLISALSSWRNFWLIPFI